MQTDMIGDLDRLIRLNKQQITQMLPTAKGFKDRETENST